MADKSWLSKLTPEQDVIANKIIERSIAMGVDPQLAVALSFRESKFDPNVRGKDGEIGVMQVMPSTGKSMGYTEKDLADIDKNIEAGLTYLKQNLDRFKNPMDAAAAYNAGPNHVFWKDPDTKNLPDSTLKYLNDIEKLGGFGVEQAEQPEPQKERRSVDVNEPSSDDILKFLLGRSDTLSDEAKQRLITDVMSAGAGAALGGAGSAGKFAVEKLAERFGSSAGPAGPAAGSSGARWAAKTGYGLGEGTTRDVVERFKAAQPQPIGGGKVTSKIKAVPGTIAPLSINAIPPQLPPPPTPSVGRQVAQGAMQMGQAASRFPMAIPTGALSGLGAVELGSQAESRYSTGDLLGAGIAGVGALGAGASLLPFAPAKVIGGGLAMASPAALYLLDKMRAGRQTPPPQ